MYISEVTDRLPEDERGPLETKVYETLKKLNIPFVRVDNDAVEAMEECGGIGEKLGAQICKTIVLCNRKKTLFFLVVLPADKHFDTGIKPGSATVMSVLNDPDRAVQVVIDREVADAPWFACNPGANTSHIRFATDKLLKVFLPHVNHTAIVAAL